MRVGHGFTLVEILIVVVILGILAMIVMPKFAGVSDEARESALLTDVQTVRRSIELYKVEHRGRLPHIDESGNVDLNAARFSDRLMKKTDRSGNIDASGACGPYLKTWPINPYMKEMGEMVLLVPFPLPPRNDDSGWCYCYQTGVFWPNSRKGGSSLFP